MKKLFVSVPMKGRTEEEIRKSIEKMHKIAEAYEGESLELINSFIEDAPPESKNPSIWYLAKSIEKMKDADLFIGLDDVFDFAGCHVEETVAYKYGIKVYHVNANIVIDNYKKLLEEIYNYKFE